MKIAIIWAYDGSRFSGSQTQKNATAAEDALNAALNKIGIFNKVSSAGRTDRGVHATAQVSSVDINECWKNRLDILKKCANKHLLNGIHIKNIAQVPTKFGARQSAKWREYRYIILNGEAGAFLKGFVCETTKNIDLQTLNSALKVFLGKHDFKGFYKSGSGEKSSVREIYKIHAYQLIKQNGKWRRSYETAHQPNSVATIIKIRANGFLRAQVRMMVANALLAAQSGDGASELKAALLSHAPLTKIPAPPTGLYLTKIHYH